jgi:hypothetical protein
MENSYSSHGNVCGEKMLYHAKASTEFVGLRSTRDGRRQVVYDTQTGKRVVINIEQKSVSDIEISEALKEGINARYVLGGVLAALKARNIDVDFTL